MTDYKTLLSDVRSKTESSEWKWLRENEARFFNPKLNTSLKTYLEAIFLGKEFIFDSTIPKDIQLKRHADGVRRFRPDARCEELNLIVEFDGVKHYQDIKQVLSDKERDAWSASAGYTVIRLPYWMTMSRKNISWKFGVDVDHGMCELHYGMFDSPVNDYGLSISPLSMCKFGYDRFIKEASCMPDESIAILQEDLDLCYAAYRDEFGLDCQAPILHLSQNSI